MGNEMLVYVWICLTIVQASEILFILKRDKAKYDRVIEFDCANSDEYFS